MEEYEEYKATLSELKLANKYILILPRETRPIALKSANKYILPTFPRDFKSLSTVRVNKVFEHNFIKHTMTNFVAVANKVEPKFPIPPQPPFPWYMKILYENWWLLILAGLIGATVGYVYAKEKDLIS